MGMLSSSDANVNATVFTGSVTGYITELVSVTLWMGKTEGPDTGESR